MKVNRKQYTTQFNGVFTASKKGDLYAHCTLGQSELTISHSGVHHKKRHIDSKRHVKRNEDISKMKTINTIFHHQQKKT